MDEIRPDDKEQLSPRSATAMGIVFILVGLAIILMGMGIIPTDPSKVHSPLWVIACAGAVFALCGAAVINGYALKKGTNINNDLVQSILGLGIIVLMLVICGWVAFGPGERNFTASSSFTASAPTDEKTGRIAFGFGFFMLLAIFGIGIWAKVTKKTRPN